jgi:hypothetical protein
MGGSAFPALDTPRLPPELYFQLKDKYTSLLKEYFPEVAVPIEAPGKTSYGDIDFIVSNDDPTTTHRIVLEIGSKLKAKATLATGPTTSLAIPCPELGEEKFVQIDVHRTDPETFAWEVFHHSHGDLWCLLGSCFRAQGFTADDRGLHIRAEEMEEHNKKLSRLLLSNEPTVVLEFLGLDAEKYWHPFTDAEELYEYVAGNRFFMRKRFIKADLKHNDKARMRKRETYRFFVDEWLPLHPEVEGTDEKTREEHLEEALERFGKRDAYNEKVASWRQMQEEKVQKRRQTLETRAAAEVGYFT